MSCLYTKTHLNEMRPISKSHLVSQENIAKLRLVQCAYTIILSIMIIVLGSNGK